jgi:hypothetical protein
VLEKLVAGSVAEVKRRHGHTPAAGIPFERAALTGPAATSSRATRRPGAGARRPGPARSRRPR